MKNVFFYDTAIGRIAIMDNGSEITEICTEEVDVKNLNVSETDLIKKASIQLREYLNGERMAFDVLFNPEGTEFQKKVWKALCDIPYGETRSYKQVAEAVGNPKASRAVGMANNRNPLMIFIPCHRVIGSNGKMVGYAGGVHIKEHLLELEKNNKK